jgi:hypothetical protein
VIGRQRQLAISRWRMAMARAKTASPWDDSAKCFRYWDDWEKWRGLRIG